MTLEPTQQPDPLEEEITEELRHMGEAGEYLLDLLNGPGFIHRLLTSN